ncbi:MAG: zf-HC2 domain-containing protein [Chloroflexi bacterium]|nr:zf-HC2 domain-containing protein [Chloroflexota bacterium]
MAMIDPKKAMQRLAGMVARTEDVEYSCDQTLRLLDEYADCVMRGEDAAAMLPLVYKHLAMCPDCMEEFEALMRVLRAGSPPAAHP